MKREREREREREEREMIQEEGSSSFWFSTLLFP